MSSTSSSIIKIQRVTKTSNSNTSGPLKIGGPMKLGAKKLKTTTNKALDDLERGLLG